MIAERAVLNQGIPLPAAPERLYHFVCVTSQPLAQFAQTLRLAAGLPLAPGRNRPSGLLL